MSENRFVLIKPGEVLLVGNAPNLNADQVNRMSDALHKTLGVRVCVFADDISIDRLDAAQMRAPAAAAVLESIVREAACVTGETVTDWQRGYADCAARVLAAVDSWAEGAPAEPVEEGR